MVLTGPMEVRIRRKEDDVTSILVFFGEIPSAMKTPYGIIDSQTESGRFVNRRCLYEQTY